MPSSLPCWLNTSQRDIKMLMTQTNIVTVFSLIVTTLDDVEHNILRPRFDDPRVHFAINCAAKSCPPLRSEPFRGDILDQQLDDANGYVLR